MWPWHLTPKSWWNVLGALAAIHSNAYMLCTHTCKLAFSKSLFSPASFILQILLPQRITVITVCPNDALTKSGTDSVSFVRIIIYYPNQPKPLLKSLLTVQQPTLWRTQEYHLSAGKMCSYIQSNKFFNRRQLDDTFICHLGQVFQNSFTWIKVILIWKTFHVLLTLIRAQLFKSNHWFHITKHGFFETGSVQSRLTVKNLSMVLS